jgi:hypothetical protein
VALGITAAGRLDIMMRIRRGGAVRGMRKRQGRSRSEPTQEFRTRETPAGRSVERTDYAPPWLSTPPEDGERTLRVGTSAQQPVVGVLIGLEGAVRGGVWKLHDGENPIGRYVLGISDLEISRDHAKIIHHAGSFGIQAVSEHSPTFVDDRPVEAEILSDGATIRLGPGGLTLRFRAV